MVSTSSTSPAQILIWKLSSLAYYELLHFAHMCLASTHTANIGDCCCGTLMMSAATKYSEVHDYCGWFITYLGVFVCSSVCVSDSMFVCVWVCADSVAWIKAWHFRYWKICYGLRNSTQPHGEMSKCLRGWFGKSMRADSDGMGWGTTSTRNQYLSMLFCV